MATFLDDYIAFIRKSTETWALDNDPATITGFNSSASFAPQTVSYMHTISTPSGSSTMTSTRNVGVVALVPNNVNVAAAGGTGTATATVTPAGTAITTESSDPSWLTATVEGNVVTWTAAANPEPIGRTATIRLATGPQSFSQMLVVTQSAV